MSMNCNKLTMSSKPRNSHHDDYRKSSYTLIFYSLKKDYK